MRLQNYNTYVSDYLCIGIIFLPYWKKFVFLQRRSARKRDGKSDGECPIVETEMLTERTTGHNRQDVERRFICGR